ncbi:hypothetical protein PENTCL1PPCAC_27923, partial [Pristionchus entomophagus]
QSPAKNQTLADLWEIYAASSDKYHKKLTELWKNKKYGSLLHAPSTALSPSTTASPQPSTTTSPPPRPPTERFTTMTSTRPPTTSAVSPRTIKVINILKRLLPDYIPQLSSIFQRVQDGNDLLMLGVTPPASTPPPTTFPPTTYFAKKSSFKRPPLSVISPKTITPSLPPSLTPTQQRAIHRMAPRLEQRTAFSLDPSTPHPPTTLLLPQPSPYTPQFPIASLDPNFSPRMLRLPEAIFAAGYQHPGVTASLPSSTMPESSPSSSMTGYRISYLPTGQTTTTMAPMRQLLPSAASFPDFIKSLTNMGPIPAKEMSQQFLAYPPSNPKFIFAAPQQSDISNPPSVSSEERGSIWKKRDIIENEQIAVVRRAERWKPWYLGGRRR